MKFSRILALALSVTILAAGVSDASAASAKRITGSALSTLLYGRQHTVYMPTGIGFTVRYDANGVMYANGKRTGDVVKATRSNWCDYQGSKLRMCVTIWKIQQLYVAKTRSGTPVYAFTIP